MLIFGLSWLEHSPSIMSIVFIKKKNATALRQRCCFFPFNTSMLSIHKVFEVAPSVLGLFTMVLPSGCRRPLIKTTFQVAMIPKSAFKLAARTILITDDITDKSALDDVIRKLSNTNINDIEMRVPAKDDLEINEGEGKEEKLPIISLSEVKNHGSSNDAWIVLYDRVYDITNFMKNVRNSYHARSFYQRLAIFILYI